MYHAFIADLQAKESGNFYQLLRVYAEEFTTSATLRKTLAKLEHPA